MSPQIIERDGKKFILIPLELFEKLSKDSESFAASKEKGQEQGQGAVTSIPSNANVPDNVVVRIEAGEVPLLVWREERGMTQVKLSLTSNISRGLIAQMETGAVQPSIGTLRKLARALDITIEDLLGDDVE